jgi:hypothetical protein
MSEEQQESTTAPIFPLPELTPVNEDDITTTPDVLTKKHSTDEMVIPGIRDRYQYINECGYRYKKRRSRTMND